MILLLFRLSDTSSLAEAGDRVRHTAATTNNRPIILVLVNIINRAPG